MLTKLFLKIGYLGLSCSLLLSFSLNALAHEFWLEPLEFNVEVGTNIQAHIKVGEGLNGDSYAFFPRNFERFDLTVNAKTAVLKNRFAKKPAVDQTTTTNGLHILTYQSKPSRLRYEKREKFEKFLKEEGIEWVLKAHLERGLPELDFTELFKRFAKTLVKVGDGKGSDRLIGMPFEWVVLTNPYTETSSKTVVAQLFFDGKPFENSAVNVFIKRDNKVSRVSLKTDFKGKVEVPVSDGGLFLINAVHMVIPDQADLRLKQAEWMSLWASTTFKIN